MSEIRYLDFDLLIVQSEDGYQARVLGSPVGPASEGFSLPFSNQDLEIFVLRVGQTRRGVRRIESPEMEAAKAFGEQLFEAVFQGAVRGCLQSSLDEATQQEAGLRIRLRLDAPELADVPWEYLYNTASKRFLTLSLKTPLVRYLDLSGYIEPLIVKPPLRGLVMISNPTDHPRLNVEQEWQKLREAVGDLANQGRVILEPLEEATLSALQKRLRRREYHIFHFIGHGAFDRRAEDGILLLEDEDGHGRPVSGQYIGALLHDQRTLRLAILNACEGARTSRTDPFAGTAQSLVQQGLPAVIAMQFEITDEAAITLAQEFYGALADGYPVDAALAESRKAIFAKGNDVEWGTPVLYSRIPGGRIFNVQSVSEEERQQALEQIAEASEASAIEPDLRPSFSSELRPPKIRAGESAQVMVQNLSSTKQDFTLTWQDQAHRLAFEPRQMQLTVPEGQSAVAKFRAALRQRRWIGGEESHVFSTQVHLGEGKTQTHTGEVISSAQFPVWTLPVFFFIGVCLLAAAVLGTNYIGDRAHHAMQTTVVVQTAIARNTLIADTDGDGLRDVEEDRLGTNPTNSDTDGDGLTDSDERRWGTNPFVVDTDSDTLTDGDEVHGWLKGQQLFYTSPMNPDTDGDGLPDNTDPHPGELPTPTLTLSPGPTAMSTPTPKPTTFTATPPPSDTPTPRSKLVYEAISLASIANSSLESEYPSFPFGESTFAGVPFEVYRDSSFTSQAIPVPDYPARVMLPVEISNPREVCLLITAGDAYTESSGKEIGKITLVFSDGQFWDVPLIVGKNIREWKQAGPGTVNTTSDVASRLAWQSGIRIIDMLTIEIPSDFVSSILVSIVIADTSEVTLDSLSPAINVHGITVLAEQ